jgi:hypothetical protein
VPALDGRQASRWAGTLQRLFLRVPADGRGIEDDIGAGHGNQAGGFGIPLVPADEDAQPAEKRLECAEAEVAGGEVEFFVVAGVVGDVHLAVQPTTSPLAPITAAALWYSPGARRSNRDAMTITPAWRATAPMASVLGPGILSAKAKVGRILGLAEIGRAEKLGQAHHLGALRGCLSNLRAGQIEIRLWLRRHGHLNQADFER